jgi:DNA adenine methylase
MNCTKCNKDILLKENNNENIYKEESIISTSNTSPLRYPGGKTRACKIIDNIIKQHFDISLFDTLLSPFFGGGSFEFYFQNKYKKRIIANDKFTPLYHFWKQVKTDKNKLCEEVRKIKIKTISKEDFANYRKSIMNINDDILQQAIQYFIINRCSFSGATLSGGFSEEASKKRFTDSSIDRIESLTLDSIEFYNLDFEIFIMENTISDKSLLFLDPPYYLENKSKLYGDNGDLHEGFDHQKLYNILKNKKNWILTYNNCEYIRNMYKDYIIIDANWSYGMNKSKKSSEMIIVSK